MVTGKGFTDRSLTEAEVSQLMTEALANVNLSGKRVLVLTPDATRSARLVVADQTLRYLELLAAVIGRHRRHDQPVAYLHPADRYRAEQVIELLHDGSRSERFRMMVSSLPAPRRPRSLAIRSSSITTPATALRSLGIEQAGKTKR